MKDFSCCFTGHRNLHYNELPNIEKDLNSAIKYCINQGVFRFYCGGALGFDTLAAKAVLSLKKSLSSNTINPCNPM